jgi:hypothetical protein
MKPIRDLLLLRSYAIRRLSWLWSEFLHCTAIYGASLYGVPALMNEQPPDRGGEGSLDHIAKDNADV